MIWTLKGDDELKSKLRYDIIMWYKHWYMGPDTVMYEHITLFEQYYTPDLFDNRDTREKDIRKFLTFLQEELGRKEME